MALRGAMSQVRSGEETALAGTARRGRGCTEAGAKRARPGLTIGLPCGRSVGSALPGGRRLFRGPGQEREAHADVGARGDLDPLRLGELMPGLAPAGLDLVGVPAARRERRRVELADRP